MRRRLRFKRSGLSRSFKAVAIGAWLVWATWAARALAQVPEHTTGFTIGESTCPEPTAVEQAILNLVPPERHELLKRSVHVELEDLGDTYTVTVSKDDAPLQKSYTDPARDCAARARFAAVFVVLTVFPPELDSEPTKPTDPPLPAPPPPPPPAAVWLIVPPSQPAPPVLQVELSGLFAAAPAIIDAPTLSTFGAEVRLALGRGVLRGTLAMAYTSRSAFELDGVRGDVTQLPASAGLRLHSRGRAWALDGDLGLLASWQRVHATDLVTWRAQRFVEFGARAGVSIARVLNPHFAPFIGAFVWFIPGPRALEALPRGTFGNLPYFWLGAAAGVSFGL
jgi:hypothetical protein